MLFLKFLQFEISTVREDLVMDEIEITDVDSMHI
jgi:hypothetical protein